MAKNLKLDAYLSKNRLLRYVIWCPIIFFAGGSVVLTNMFEPTVFFFQVLQATFYPVFLGLLFLSFAGIRQPSIYFLSVFCCCSLSFSQWYLNLIMVPDSMGFLINSLGDGGDDKAFFLGVVAALEDGKSVHPFSQMVAFLLSPLHQLRTVSIFDCLAVNATFHAIGSVAIYEIIRKLTNCKRSLMYFAFVIYIFNGSLIMHGLTFMREGVLAALFVLFLFCVINHKIWLCLVMVALIGYLRNGAALLIISVFFPALFFYYKRFFPGKVTPITKRYSFALLLVVLFIVSLPITLQYLRDKEIVLLSLFRISFVEENISAFTSSYFINIFSFNWLVLKIVLSLFFMFAPLLNVELSNFWLPYNLSQLAFGVLQTFCIPLFCSAYLLFPNKHQTFEKEKLFFIKFFTWAFLIFMGVLSVYSLQLRHKEMFLPLFLILAALGAQNLRRFVAPLPMFVGVVYVFLSIMFW
ncbi:hypothetical protein N9D90_01020 [Alphaproteobacteria bacterium]|nr:hypothetical protein [Alphaproteobacteria bacterium]